MIAQFFAWYLVVQLLTLVALPMTLRLFENLPDRGYAFAKSVGIFAVGIVLWLGYSYGLLRNEPGGIWLSVLIVGALSTVTGWPLLRRVFAQIALAQAGGKASPPEEALAARQIANHAPWRLNIQWGYVLLVELLFLLSFAGWAYVRAHDPAINHTEQPMDLMFMNGIWGSPTYPPRDPWLAGYSISYYYLGYWFLVVLGKMSGLLPEVAYNVGQACWLGLLLIGCFGLTANLLALQGARLNRSAGLDHDTALDRSAGLGRSAALGGLLSAAVVGLMGNLQVVLEWLHANGVDVTALARLFNVRGFPEEAAVTNSWYIGGGGWWWWRSSRVIRDVTLQGGHSEVIDEFPMFSYLLGDNHPHVMAMPFVLLVIGLALNMVLRQRPPLANGDEELALAPSGRSGWRAHAQRLWREICAVLPMGWWGGTVLVATSGSLIFLNTWDYPAYWLLFMVGAAVLLFQNRTERELSQVGRAVLGGVLFGAMLLIGAILFYLPYFLAAQSQADGLAPNLFNPTRLGQCLLMFGAFMPALVGLALVAWRTQKPSLSTLLTAIGLSLGAPLLWLLMSALLALNTPTGQEMLAQMPLGADYASYGAAMLARWGAQPYTFLLGGLLLGVLLALVWSLVMAPPSTASPAALDRTALLFALLLATLGVGLAYAPEFVYLRDHFGTRMNTVFKFYYQAWLLLGLSSAYTVVLIARSPLRKEAPMVVCAALALLLMAGGMIFPVAGVLSKTNNFAASTLTFSGIEYIAQSSPDEMAAIEWVRQNTSPDMVILERMGDSYNAAMNRISAATGRATLVGWGGHESQWRGDAYAEMAAGRGDVLTLIYKTGSPQDIERALDEWDIDYVYVGPTERSQYELGPGGDQRLLQAMDLAFESGNVRIFARRGGN